MLLVKKKIQISCMVSKVPFWKNRKLKCTVYVGLIKQPLNLFKLDQQSRGKALRPYCPNIYTVNKAERASKGRKIKLQKAGFLVIIQIAAQAKERCLLLQGLKGHPG